MTDDSEACRHVNWGRGEDVRRLLGLDPLDSGHGIEIRVEGAEPIKLVLEHHGGVQPVPRHQVGIRGCDSRFI